MTRGKEPARRRVRLPAEVDDAGGGRTGRASVSPVRVVGIGASAGGFPALEAFLGALPGDCPFALVIVQHLDPDSESRLPDVLRRWTALPVAEARDGVGVRPGHVYVIPPGHSVEVRGGRLRVAATRDSHDRRFPIDRLFRALGEDAGELAMGVVLSGSGSDGALGLKAIADAGGLVLVQDPSTAEFAGMPQAAIATGLATRVLAPAAMPEVCLRFARRTSAARGAGRSADAEARLVDPVIALMRQQQRFDLSIYKRSTLARRIRRRMSLGGLASIDAYLRHLALHPGEVASLLQDMLIGVTDFFRDPEAWSELEREAIVPLVAAKGDLDPIRVWVLGAATGEEAYSLAMLLLDEVRKSGKHCPVQVFATDASEDALRIARTGVYPVSIAASVDPERMARHFVPATQEGHVQVSPALRDCLLFGLHNVLADPPFSRLDLVSCRNLLIYIEAEVQRRVIGLFHFALLPRGWLFLGSAETVGPLSELFEPVSRRWRIYRRTDGEGREPLGFVAPSLPNRGARAVASTNPAAFRESRTVEFAQHVILDRFAPACVLIDAEFRVSYFCGPTSDFLALRRGAPTTDLLVLARECLRSRLKQSVEQAIATGRTVVVKDAMMKKDGAFERVRLTVMPTHGDGPGRRLFLVVFEPVAPVAAAGASGVVTGEVVQQLEDELRVAREELESSVRRFSVSNEQLQLANEEIIAVNEELQSTNEELESSKEELQSLNEELATVNQQLQHKVAELEVVNADLGNLLESIDIAIVCVDEERRVKWFTPAVRHLLQLVEGDVGRPIADFARPLSGARMPTDLSAVLYGGRMVQREVRGSDERWLLRRMTPYRTAEGAIAGAVISFTDITQSKRAAEAAVSVHRETATRLEAEVRERTAQLHDLARALGQTEARERERLAVRLHDDLAQLLAGARLKLAALQAGPRGPEGALRDVDALIARAEASVRTAVFDLSPPSLRKSSLLRTLEDLALELERTYGLDVALHDDGSPKAMDRELKETLYRAVRELLLNVVKHAGVSRADVTLARIDGNVVRITVSDLGKGFEWPRRDGSEQGRFGLASIRDRLRLIGGDVRVRTQPGTGTEVVLSASMSHRRAEGES